MQKTRKERRASVLAGHTGGYFSDQCTPNTNVFGPVLEHPSPYLQRVQCGLNAEFPHFDHPNPTHSNIKARWCGWKASGASTLPHATHQLRVRLDASHHLLVIGLLLIKQVLEAQWGFRKVRQSKVSIPKLFVQSSQKSTVLSGLHVTTQSRDLTHRPRPYGLRIDIRCISAIGPASFDHRPIRIDEEQISRVCVLVGTNLKRDNLRALIHRRIRTEPSLDGGTDSFMLFVVAH